MTILLFLLSATLATEERPGRGKQAPPKSPGARVDTIALMPLKPRGIGPAVMGGRVSDIAMDPKDPFTFYVALGTGGLMKTSDNGGTWKAVFDKEAVASIGAVAIAPSDPSVVWVGTGEANDRNSSGWGNGVYRSTDGGHAWTHVGLPLSRTIPRIVVHPKDPLTAWVAAMGDLWVPGPERGLYKTTDGGQTWKAVLTAPALYTDRVGCGDVALDPQDPNILYAALYARRRTPWSFASGPAITDGKDLGGIFKSSDGGVSWKKLTLGLPTGTGRIGLSVHARDTRIVYAIVESDEGGRTGLWEVRSKHGGVFRSEDGGETWARMSPLDPRPFYFSQVRVDPEDAGRVYVLGFALHVSQDGGRSFREDRFEKVHPDCHALAIDPRNTQRLLLGTDGGVYQSLNGGEVWEHLNRMAAGEYYRIAVDMSVPYRICGGLQDNRTWVGPSTTRTKDGPLNSDWTNLGGGDGFACVFDSDDPDTIYFESQEGFLERINLRTGATKNLRPSPGEGQPDFRFHWNAPLFGSRHEKDALYLAGNRVFKLLSRGEDWKAISPDSSGQDPQKIAVAGSGAETSGVVYTLAESPIKAGLLWAGTDDGRLWVTANDGGSWTDLTPHLPAAVKGQWISRIEASAHDPAVAYMAVDGHRSGEYKPLVYRTSDEGRSWVATAADLPSHGPVKVIREDPFNPLLLFVGTEFGLYVSLDRGEHWTKWPEVPTVAVDDIVIHPRERDLVIATHGRSLYIVDDIRPLEELTAEVLQAPAHLFTPRPASGFSPLPGSSDWGGTVLFKGSNPPEGAILSFHVREYTGEPVKIDIETTGGQPVAKLTAPGVAGFGRLTWDLKPSKELLTEYGGEGQRFVPSGDYVVTLRHGKTKAQQRLSVQIPPGIETR